MWKWRCFTSIHQFESTSIEISLKVFHDQVSLFCARKPLEIGQRGKPHNSPPIRLLVSPDPGADWCWGKAYSVLLLRFDGNQKRLHVAASISNLIPSNWSTISSRCCCCCCCCGGGGGGGGSGAFATSKISEVTFCRSAEWMYLPLVASGDASTASHHPVSNLLAAILRKIKP